jgi:hypothetical protein
MRVVIVNTKVTAIPNPFDAFKSLEIEMNEHIPKKRESRMLLVKTEAMRSVKGCTSGVIFSLPFLRE